MKKIENIYIKSIGFALFIDLGIIVFMYAIPYLNSAIVLWVPDSLLMIGVALFFYAALFCIIYFIKIVMLLIIKKEKYSKEEKIKDVKLILSSLVGISIIFILFYGQVIGLGSQPLDKPVIYLYPESEVEVSVKFGNEKNLLHTYPKYIDGWNVIAKPNGNLVDIKTGRSLYCLYWEGKDNTKIDTTEGFVVKGEDTIKFLEEKLSVLGLNEREANEFIIYWLPKMENNKYNYVRFRTNEEINNYMQLDIFPKPDSIIRIVMDFKPLNKYVSVKEQKLNTPQRIGFVVVEWGARHL